MSTPLSHESIHGIDPATLTPAMRQYQQYKTQYPDAILFFRMGDFYELFYEDARTAARVLGVALTSRSKGENPIPMAGVPFHAVDSYLHRMISAGYKVAICEQMENPKDAKGVIKREVTRLVTPGTLTEENMLDGREENFLAALVLGTEEDEKAAGGRRGGKRRNGDGVEGGGGAGGGVAAVAWCELSTGKFLTMVGSLAACLEEVARVGPRELIHAEAADHRAPEWTEGLRTTLAVTLTARPAWELEAHHAAKTLREHYGVASFAGFGYESEKDLALRAAGAVVAYLHETQKTALEHLRPPRNFERQRHLVIDPTSLRSLEILRTLRGNAVGGSLVGALDATLTPMGSRLLRNWLCYPLRDVEEITRRQDCIGQLMDAPRVLERVRGALADCSDIERITARICCRRAMPRDLVALARSLETLAAVAGFLGEEEGGSKAGLEQPTPVSEISGKAEGESPWAELLALAPGAQEIAGEIRAAISDEPATHLRDGGVMRDGHHAELDRLRTLSRDSRTWLADYQGKLVTATGIPSLKVGYNKVFGFYIEITHAHAEKIPANFVRKQTVKNAERYITPELKQYEADILTAQERSVALEQELYEGLRTGLSQRAERLQELAQRVAALDVYCAMAHLAQARRYCRPRFEAEGGLVISEGRHPVVEQSLGEKFVANDTSFKGDGATLQLITGPNMAGKSTYIRQVALLVIMAQAGLFIPAKEATLGLVDRVFTRVGASDDLAAGQSTFMVEMIETANILHYATADSLVILDEIGRGTSTLDGLALAWAIAEYLADTAQARTLFATHYHELTELAETNRAVVNYNVLVREWEDQVIFMHRIVAGQADKSYGVHVARLAGVPRSVVTRARHLLNQLSVQVGRPRARAAAAQVAPQINMFDTTDQQALTQLKALDMDRMSPMQAWEALRALQGMMGEKKTP